MYDSLLKLMILASLAQLGLTLSDLSKSTTTAGQSRVRHASNAVLHVDWKPISVFSNEAKRFR